MLILHNTYMYSQADDAALQSSLRPTADNGRDNAAAAAESDVDAGMSLMLKPSHCIVAICRPTCCAHNVGLHTTLQLYAVHCRVAYFWFLPRDALCA